MPFVIMRPHVSLMGLDLAPIWIRLLSGQRARSLALLSMSIYFQNMIMMIRLMSTVTCRFMNFTDSGKPQGIEGILSCINSDPIAASRGES